MTTHAMGGEAMVDDSKIESFHNIHSNVGSMFMFTRMFLADLTKVASLLDDMDHSHPHTI